MFDNIELCEELAQKKKLDGIEVYHYSANKENQDKLLKIAENYDLIVTGGSDFHGLYNAVPTHIGSKTTDEENIKKIFSLIDKNSQR